LAGSATDQNKSLNIHVTARRLEYFSDAFAWFFQVATRDVSEQAHMHTAGLLTRCLRKNVERLYQ
jgi:hypothetical protein